MTNKLPEDNAIRREVVNPAYSFVVSAPAGSGKTGLLTLRVLELLCVVDKPEEILAITFTRKAAAEMHERVFRCLERASCVSDDNTASLSEYDALMISAAKKVLARSQQRQWELLSTPSRLNIATIDGFCKSICNQLPFFSAVGSSTSVIEEAKPEYNLVTQRWLLDALNQSENGDILTLVDHFSGNMERLTALFSELLSVRDQWLPLLQIGADSRTLKNYFEDTLSTWVQQSILRVRRFLLPYEGEIFDFIAYAEKHAAHAKDPSLIFALAAYSEFPDSKESSVDFWRSLAQFCLTKNNSEYKYRQRFDKNMGFPSFSNKDENTLAKNTKNAMLKMLSDLEESGLSAELFADLMALPEPVYEEAHWIVLEALITVLPKLVAYLKLRFSELGQADFTEFSLGAVRALDHDMGDLDLQQRLDYKIQHILLDEFQDTSQTQLDLLRALTNEWQPGDGKTLFLVGDGMQSCYGFRNANVGIFLSMRHQGLENIELRSRNLSVNFRSDQCIVDWVNSAFCEVFPEQDDINSGAVQYIPSTAFHKTKQHSFVRCDAFAKGTDDEARKIAEEVSDLLVSHPDDSIAILARSRSHLQQIISVFEQKGIDYLATDFDPLISKQHVVDIHSLAQCLFDEGNSLSYLAVLRSPMCALNHADLFHLFNHHEENEDKPNSVLALILSVLNTTVLSTLGKQRLSRLYTELTDAQRYIGRRSFAELVEILWLKLGGAECLSTQSEIEDIQNYLSLLTKLEVANCIENWALIDNALATEYAAPATRTKNPVQIMTMHKSKGLEFDTVFLPALDKRRRGDDSDVLYWLEQLDAQLESHFILSPINAKNANATNKITDYIRAQKSVKSRHEDLRIFYVACTRAKKRLYLSANFDHDEDGELKPADKSAFISKIWSKVLPELQHNELITKHNTGTRDRSNIAPAPTLMALPLSWQFQFDSPSETKVETVFDNSEFDFFESWHTQATEKRIEGIVIHAVLQLCAYHSLDELIGEKTELLRQFILNRLRSEGLPYSELKNHAENILSLMRSLASDEILLWILSREHRHAHSEWSLWHRLSGQLRENVIDRSFVDVDTRWVIDYKTAQPSDGQNLDAFFAEQISQHHQQLLRYRDIVSDFDKHDLGDEQIKCIKLGLYFPLSQDFHHLSDLDLSY